LGITINFDRTKLFSYLRLILFAVVLIYYFNPTANYLRLFASEKIVFAKNYFLFVYPAGVASESDVSDFATFYASGLLNKERLTKYPDIDVYDPVLLTQTVGRLIAPMQPEETYYIQYPPIFFVLTTPLAYFDLYTAWRIWVFASAICLVIAFLCIVYDKLKTRPLLAFGLFICLINNASNELFSIGQTTAFEIAIIAIAFRLLLNKNYFWAGLIAGIAFFKLQQALIILIPGIFIGRSRFFYGTLITLIVESILSAYLVGYNNVLNFIRANYLCEIVHCYVGLNETWSMSTFRALLSSWPYHIDNANIIAAAIYLFCCVISAGLWIILYPALKKYSDQALELLASISTIILVYFSMHGYLYDYLLMIFPALWLYMWSTSNDSRYTKRQSIIRLLTSLISFTLLFLLFTNYDLSRSENTNVGFLLRYFFGTIIFLFCAISAVVIEFKQGHLAINAQSNT
jgi:hypothetical protein